MAQRTTVMLVDDLDASIADQSVEFGIDGVTYGIDLTDAHAAALRDALAPYIARARRGAAGGRSGRGRAQRPVDPDRHRTSTPATAAASSREQNQAIRHWASRHSHPVSSRGRIPAAVVEAFHRGDPDSLPAAGASRGALTPAPSPAQREPVAAPATAATASSPPRLGPDGLASDERERIRAWAIEEGIEVKTRGRLTKDLIANYRAVQARR